MTRIEDLRLQYFEHCKGILSELQNIENESDLINQKSSLDALIENIAFLKHLQQNEGAFTQPIPLQQFEAEDELSLDSVGLTPASDSSGSEASQFSFAMAGPILTETEEQDPVAHENVLVEKANLSEKLEDQDLIEDVSLLEEQVNEELVSQEALSVFQQEDRIFEDDAKEEVSDFTEASQPELVNELDLDLELSQTPRGTEPTQEFESQSEGSKELFHTEPHEHKIEKKFKLAHIKGLSGAVSSLFEQDHLDLPNEVEKQVLTSEVTRRPEQVQDPKQRTQFKLDLNDRIAFTKILFDGSQSELNHTVNELNDFKDLEQAKDYLSQVYHKRNWKTADEYAQRLWMLVETKFQ